MDSKDDIGAENLTLSQPNLALSESSNKLSQVKGAAGLNPSVQYLQTDSGEGTVVSLADDGEIPSVHATSDNSACREIWSSAHGALHIELSAELQMT